MSTKGDQDSGFAVSVRCQGWSFAKAVCPAASGRIAFPGGQAGDAAGDQPQRKPLAGRHFRVNPRMAVVLHPFATFPSCYGQRDVRISQSLADAARVLAIRARQ